MTSCLILLKCLIGDVTRAGRDVKRHCPPLQSEILNPVYYDTDFRFRKPEPHVPAPCQRIPCFAEGVECGGLTRMEGRKDRQMKVDHPALRPTCCLCNALIRFTSEWTWHCDMKEFHSLDVRSSPYCINMPLMFHSDTGL